MYAFSCSDVVEDKGSAGLLPQILDSSVMNTIHQLQKSRDLGCRFQA